jgi:hypothetical protein
MGLLIANDLRNIGCHETKRDSQLIDAALLWLNKRILEGQKPDVHRVRDMCVEAVRQVRRRRAEAMARSRHRGDLLDVTIRVILYLCKRYRVGKIRLLSLDK